MNSQIGTLAIRSLFRNKRRAVVTLIAVAFATLMGIVLRGIQIGTYEANIRQALLLSTGAGQIQDTGYLSVPSLSNSFAYSTHMLSRLSAVDGVKNIAPTLTIAALSSASGTAKPVVLQGVDATKEQRVSLVPDKIVEGTWLAPEPSNTDFAVVIGKEYARRHNTVVGDTIVLIGSDRYGAMSNEFFVVCGIYGLGVKQMEATTMYTHIQSAEWFASVDSACTMLKYTVEDVAEAQTIATALSQQLDSELISRPWTELMPEMQQQIEMDDISGLVMVGVLLLLVVLGVANTVYMSVVERFREFGIMLAIGTRNVILLRLVLTEVGIATCLGIIIGLVPGVAINAWIQDNPIELSSELGDLYAEYGFLPQIHSVVDIESILALCTVILISSVVSAALPLWRVYTLEPLKGIRHT